MNCVILMVKSKWNIWYSEKLKPWIHFVPVKEDLSDLVEKILWCKNNDSKCSEIAKQSRKFYEENLNKKAILNNLKNTLNELSHVCSIPPYPIVKLSDIKLQIEDMVITRKMSETNITLKNSDFEIFKLIFSKTLLSPKDLEIFSITRKLLSILNQH